MDYMTQDFKNVDERLDKSRLSYIYYKCGDRPIHRKIIYCRKVGSSWHVGFKDKPSNELLKKLGLKFCCMGKIRK